jgi:hypothetical protein
LKVNGCFEAAGEDGREYGRKISRDDCKGNGREV